MPTNFLARLKTLRFRLKTALHDRFVLSSAFSCIFVLSLLYPFILKLVTYFSPLLFSTAICFMAFYLFMLSERQATKEILLVHGEKSEHGVVHVYDDEVNHSIYKDHTEACCFLLRPKSEEDDRAIFAGKINVGLNNLGVFGEEVTSCVVDRLAEGAWNCYFGKSSKWHYVGNMTKENESKEM